MTTGEKTAVIVAGGQGTRIRSISGESMPKALVPVAGEPIVFRQLDLLERYGYRRLVVMAGHLAEVTVGALQPEARRRGFEIEFCVESEPLGTAGNLHAAKDLISSDDFVVLYGDIAVEMDIDRLAAFHGSRGGIATIVAHPNDHPETSDLLVADGEGRVSAILRRGRREPGWYRNLVPAALYVLNRDIFDRVEPGKKQDFIGDVFPRLLEAGKAVYAYNTPEYLCDMGTVERYAMVEADIRSGLMAGMNLGRKRPTVFFDRDGVLNEDIPGRGITCCDELKLLPGAAEAVRRVNKSGALAVLVTNQPQVAKGFTAVEELNAIHGKLETLLGREGAKLDRIYYCPHHPDKGFEGEVAPLKVACGCRKPLPGMVLKAAKELSVDMGHSAVIGDSRRDVGLAYACGLHALGVRTGTGCGDCSAYMQPDAIFPTVLEAVDHALENVVAGAARPVERSLS